MVDEKSHYVEWDWDWEIGLAKRKSIRLILKNRKSRPPKNQEFRPRLRCPKRKERRFPHLINFNPTNSTIRNSIIEKKEDVLCF